GASGVVVLERLADVAVPGLPGDEAERPGPDRVTGVLVLEDLADRDLAEDVPGDDVLVGTNGEERRPGLIERHLHRQVGDDLDALDLLGLAVPERLGAGDRLEEAEELRR